MATRRVVCLISKGSGARQKLQFQLLIRILGNIN